MSRYLHYFVLAVNYYGFTLDAADLGHSRLLQRQGKYSMKRRNKPCSVYDNFIFGYTGITGPGKRRRVKRRRVNSD